ncbi:MAG: hypothetical protein C4345_10460 [Chloroflexota bacterium]
MLTLLEGKPAQLPGQIQREAQQTLELLGKERYAFLLRQLNLQIAEAEQAKDEEALASLKQQLAALAERHRAYYPPPSPYFRDTRDKTTPKPAIRVS